MPRAKLAGVVLSEQERFQLDQIVRSGTEEQRLVTRARIILGAADGRSSKSIAEKLGISRTTVSVWCKRFIERRQAAETDAIRAWLSDQPRTGAPDRIKLEQWVDILALATTKPASEGVEETHWSSSTLARTAMEKGIVKSIHRSTVSRFLRECTLKPHRVVGWMNRKKDADFDERATKVKDLLCKAVEAGSDPVHVVASFDEKTGIQATERIAPDKPMQIGRPVKQEYEYTNTRDMAPEFCSQCSSCRRAA